MLCSNITCTFVRCILPGTCVHEASHVVHNILFFMYSMCVHVHTYMSYVHVCMHLQHVVATVATVLPEYHQGIEIVYFFFPPFIF